MTEIFPSLPGLGWSVSKAPRFATRMQKAISGRELRIADQIYPIWTWTLTYEILRDSHDIRGPGGLGIGFDELRLLGGFFLQRQGAFQSFQFNDPTDNAVIGQQIGTGNTVQTTWQLVRTFGGFVEPIYFADVHTIYFNGSPQSPSSYTIYPMGLVTFNSPPGAVSITADFGYNFLVRFVEDIAEFENFMYQLWSLKQIKLQSVLA